MSYEKYSIRIRHENNRQRNYEGQGKLLNYFIISLQILLLQEDMIENEIAIMRLCRHPNIIKLVEEFETLENIYLILELVRGGDLFDAITESVRYDESTASALVADLAAPIAYLHARNIVHRDVKPENCLLERHPNGKLQIKLADFGLAMEVTKPIFQVCGTPTYVAPESEYTKNKITVSGTFF